MRLFLVTAVAAAALLGLPAQSAIVSLASNVDLGSAPYTVNIGSDAAYTFSYIPNGNSSVSISMAGTAQVYGNGFFSPNKADPLQIGVDVPDQLSLGQFFQQTGTQAIDYSISQSSVALRFITGGETYFGYATVGGSNLIQLAFNNTPGGSILTGQAAESAVPEPISWAMFIFGFGLIGAAIRRKKVRVSFA